VFNSPSWRDWAQPLEVVVPPNPGKLYLVKLTGPHMVLN
jgi:hypothetical protein